MTLVMDVDGWDSDAGVGFKVLEAAARRASPIRTYQIAQATVPEHTLLTTDPLYEPRVLEVRGFMENTSAANHASDLDQLKARLKGQVASTTRNEVALEFDDRAGKEYAARMLSFTAVPVTESRLYVDEITITALLIDPYLRDSSATTDTGITTATAVPLGTAPSWPTFTINAAFTNPRIDYQNSGSSVVKSLEFTIDSTAEGITDLIIDMEAGTIVDNAGANRHSHRNSGTNFPWMLDARDGVYWSWTWPTLEVSSGTLDISYVKRWE